jgi:DNA-binding XRE family transcriptional regulator
MDTCGKCGGGARIQPIPRHQMRKELMGGMHIELVDSVHALVCEKCGNIVRTDIPDTPGLIAAVSIARAKVNLKLNGDEIKFLRKAMGMSAKELAKEIRVSDETVSRWENGHLVMGDPMERIFRWKVCKALEEKAPGIKWDDDDILTRMNIVAVSAQPLVMYFQRGLVKRREQWREEKLKQAA